MSEKVIHEIRIIETDDGFRIEIKGDKERLKEMGFGQGFGPFGGMRHFGPPWAMPFLMMRRFRHGPWGMGHQHGPHAHHGHGRGNWGWGGDPQWGQRHDEQGEIYKPEGSSGSEA